MMHCTMDDLLALRAGEGAAWARPPAAGCGAGPARARPLARGAGRRSGRAAPATGALGRLGSRRRGGARGAPRVPAVLDEAGECSRAGPSEGAVGDARAAATT